MTQNAQSGNCTLGSLGLAVLCGLFVAVIARIIGELSWPGSVFLGVIAAVLLAALFLWLFCRPLPALAATSSNTAANSDRAGDAPASAAAAQESVAKAPAPAPTPAPVVADVDEGISDAFKPSTLDAARDGGPDDLKLIKGVGPKLEGVCHKLGFYHFDQVASWTDKEVAWVDANLEGFKGRVTRDGWVEQAKILAAGGETEFSAKKKK